MVVASQESIWLVHLHGRLRADRVLPRRQLRLCYQLSHRNRKRQHLIARWYAVEGAGLAPLLKQALPYLQRVNLSVSRRSPLGFGRVATIEPLDTGEMDNFAVIALPHRLGYTGMQGYLGCDEGGAP